MILSLSFQILCLTGSLVLLAMFCHKVKLLFADGTYALTREVEGAAGEHCTASFNTYTWESSEKKFQKYQKMIASIEARKEYCHDRFQRILSEARQENKEGA